MISGSPGMAGGGSCQVCGATPAQPIKLISHRGYVLMFRNWTERPTLCRDCGLARFRQVQGADLAAGWWGIVSVFLNTFAVFSNLFSWMRIRQMGEPMRTGAVQPLPAGRPVLMRPGAWITAAAIAIIGFALVTSIGRDDLKTFPAEDRALVGTCVENVGGTGSQPASCSGAHSGKVVRLTHSQSGCDSQQVTIDLNDGNYACSDTTQ